MGTRDGLLVQLGTKRYTVDTEGITWRTVEVTRRGVDQGATDGEASLSNQVTWRRLRDNFVGGAGQEWADLTGDDASSDIRFWESSEMDPWERRRLALGWQRKLFYTPDSTANVRRVLTMNTAENIAVVDGTEIHTFAIDPAAGTATEVHAGTIAKAVTDATISGGDQIFVQTDGDIYLNDRSGADGWVLFATLATTFIQACKSRLIAANGNHLFEILASGRQRDLHRNCSENNWAYKGATSAPNAIYVWGDDGIQSEIFRTPLDEATGGIATPVSAAELPIGEMVQSMIVYLGRAVVGTNLGVRIGVIANDGGIQLGPLLDEIGSVTSLAGAKSYVYLTSETAPGLWRLNLGKETSTLAPAFATEPVNVTGAVLSDAVEQDLRSVTTCVVDGQVVIATAGAVDTWSTIDKVDALPYSPEGWVDLGWFTYGIGEEKSLDTITVEMDAIPVGSTATVRVVVDSPTTDGVIDELVTPAAGATTVKVCVEGESIASDRFRVRLYLAADTAADTTPVVRRVTIRATPVPFISDEIILPVIITEGVEDENGQVYTLDVLEEWQYLLGLRDGRTRFTFAFGGYTAAARIEELGVQSGGLGAGNGLDGWSAKNDMAKGIWQVRLVTVDTCV